MDILTEKAKPSPQQMEMYLLQWSEWIQHIAAQNRLADGGNHFSRQGKVLTSGNRVNETPYVADGISVAGYILIYAHDWEEATQIAGQCPILQGENTSVEIREVDTL